MKPVPEMKAQYYSQSYCDDDYEHIIIITLI